MTSDTYLLLADVVLGVHFAFAGFVVLGLAAIWIGRAFRRKFVHNPWFRLAHLGAMAVVVAQVLGGVTCPLTIWESRLRILAGEQGPYRTTCMRHWAEYFFYYSFSQSVFTIIYIVFFALMLASLLFVPIRFKRRSDKD